MRGASEKVGGQWPVASDQGAMMRNVACAHSLFTCVALFTVRPLHLTAKTSFCFPTMNNLTLDERKWLLKQYWKTENARQVRDAWQAHFQTPPPSRQAIYKLRDKFERDGYVGNKKQSGRKKTSSTEDNEITVAQTFVNSPTKSTRRAASELAIPGTSLMRLMKSLK